MPDVVPGRIINRSMADCCRWLLLFRWAGDVGGKNRRRCGVPSPPPVCGRTWPYRFRCGCGKDCCWWYCCGYCCGCCCWGCCGCCCCCLLDRGFLRKRLLDEGKKLPVPPVVPGRWLGRMRCWFGVGKPGNICGWLL